MVFCYFQPYFQVLSLCLTSLSSLVLRYNWNNSFEHEIDSKKKCWISLWSSAMYRTHITCKKKGKTLGRSSEDDRWFCYQADTGLGLGYWRAQGSEGWPLGRRLVRTSLCMVVRGGLSTSKGREPWGLARPGGEPRHLGSASRLPSRSAGGMGWGCLCGCCVFSVCGDPRGQPCISVHVYMCTCAQRGTCPASLLGGPEDTSGSRLLVHWICNS